MNTVLITARFGLAAVFVVAAIAKLADMPGSRRALESFAVPGSLVRATAAGLPLAELASAALLIFAPTAQGGGVLAVLLLAAFAGGIAAALRRGTAPDCHCFGQLHSKPAGTETLVRNGVLAAVAVLVISAGPGPSLTEWLSASPEERVALGGTVLLVVLLAYVCFTLWEENRRLREAGTAAQPQRQLEVGQPAPQFATKDLHGAPVGSRDLISSEQRTVLVFVSATCGPCLALLPELARWREMLVGRLNIHVLASGDQGTNRAHSEAHGMPVHLDPRGQAAHAFAVTGTPSAVEIDAGGCVAAPAAVGAPAIEGLLRAALKRPAPTAGLEVQQVGAALAARTT